MSDTKQIFLHNTATGKKELFQPLSADVHGVAPTVTMYHCGPTVYNYAHIGNLRSYVFADTLRRMFEWNGYAVKQVINITDIGHLVSDGDAGDDKMTNALKREGKPMTLEAMREVGDFYFEKFRDDLIALNIELPEKFPFASDHIAEDIAMIEKLTTGGFTYTISDGVYFDTEKFPEYGALGGVSRADESKIGEAAKNADSHSRIGLNSEKKNPRDFALWKFSGKNAEKQAIGYESPFGRGFPGWHIECSAMSVKYLGPQFDIHTGGIDHISVHHNNEIAQAVCAGYPFARYWMHNAFLNIKNDTGEDIKMAKSGENFITLPLLSKRVSKTVLGTLISPLDLRYLYLSAHYSSQLDFTWDALDAAHAALWRLRRIVREFLKKLKFTDRKPRLEVVLKKKAEFMQLINNDLDTPKVIALIWDVIKDTSLNEVDAYEIIREVDNVLGLNLVTLELVDEELPIEIQEFISLRQNARNDKNWALSDKLRKDIEDAGYLVKDGDNGMEVEKK